MSEQKPHECVQCGEEVNTEDIHAEWIQGEGWLCSFCSCQRAEARVEREVAEAEERIAEERENSIYNTPGLSGA